MYFRSFLLSSLFITLSIIIISSFIIIPISCGNGTELCPPVANFDQEATEDKYCCQALIDCCQQLENGDEKTKCLHNANQGGNPFCQSRYQELRSNDKCKAFTSLDAKARE